MTVSNDLSQINAEMLLNYLYPEMEEHWVARHAGTFYRNYNRDHMSVYNNTNEVVLARDGFLQLLPEGLVSSENELKGKNVIEKYKKLETRKKIFKEAFLPFDAFSFRTKLVIERYGSELLEDKLNWLLKTYFNYDLEAEQNPYIREFAVLLPFVSKMRADFSALAKLLGTVIHCRTKLKIGRYSDVDSTRYWIPCIEYQLLIPGLTAEGYQRLRDDILPLQAFLIEWFIPAEVRCTITIKQHYQPLTTDGQMVLDYNTEIDDYE